MGIFESIKGALRPPMPDVEAKAQAAQAAQSAQAVTRGAEGKQTSKVVPTPNIEKYPTIVGPNLTPARVAQALRKANNG